MPIKTFSTLLLFALFHCLSIGDLLSQSRQRFVAVNDSSQDADLYSRRPSGTWQLEKTVRSRDSQTFNNAYRGDEYGFSNPNRTGIDIIVQSTVGTRNTLTLRDRDIPRTRIIARDIKITNNSSVSVDVYADDGGGTGWQFVDTLRPYRPGSTVPGYGAIDGHKWCIDDPNQRGVQPLKQKTIQVWDRLPTLSIADYDLSQRSIAVTNDSSRRVDVYSSTDGRSWRRMRSLDPRGGRRDNDVFITANGTFLGFDDPLRIGIDILNSTEITSRVSRLSINDADFPAIRNTRSFTAINNCATRIDVYSSPDGRRWNYERTLDARGSAGDNFRFTGEIGDRWGFDDPSGSGINIVKNTPISILTTRLTVSDSDIGPPRPRLVKITFINEDGDSVAVYRKTGPFRKAWIGTIPGEDDDVNGRLTLDLTPGDSIVAYADDDKVLEIRSVPGTDATYRIDD